MDTGGGGVLRVQQRDGGMLGAGKRRASEASLRGNRNSWSQPCWERAAVGVIVEGVVGLRSWHPLFGGAWTGKRALVGRCRGEGADNVGEFEVEVQAETDGQGKVRLFGKQQAASKRRWREAFTRCQRWTLAPTVRTGSQPHLRHCPLRLATGDESRLCGKCMCLSICSGSTAPCLPTSHLRDTMHGHAG